MTRTKSIYLALLAVLLSPMAANADVIVQSTLDDVSEVDYWYFTVNVGGTITIDTLSWEWDVDSDGFANIMDPMIHLFSDDGSLDAGDLLDSNDDSGGTFGDGSTSSLDSFMSIGLAAGDYVLAISDYFFSALDAVAGTNTTGTSIYAFDGTDYYGGDVLDCPEAMDCSFADYQITFGGDVTVTNAVPEPGTLALLGIGLLGMGLSRRRKKV